MKITYPEDPSTIPPDKWKRLNMTVAEYKAMRAERVERERRAPAVGQMAPDFEIERLSPDGKTRTGERFRLSDTRGQPVALIFGSYT